jgi:hypothetical protein
MDLAAQSIVEPKEFYNHVRSVVPKVCSADPKGSADTFL